MALHSLGRQLKIARLLPRIIPKYIWSSTYPVNTSDPRNLVGVRIEGNSFTYNPAGNLAPLHFFAITASDRYHNESTALQKEALLPSDSYLTIRLTDHKVQKPEQRENKKRTTLKSIFYEITRFLRLTPSRRQ